MARSCTVACVLALGGAAAAAAAAACGRPAPPAPPADLIAATFDSSYWITSDRRGLRARGAPILLTRADGRFRELYVADDDRSFYDAVLVGQRLFVRDLLRGDSLELLADSVVPRLAREYAVTHPREEPLAPDEEASPRPRTTATAEFEVLDVHGPYVSYEYRTDVDVTGERHVDRHATRRGVLDLRTGKQMTLDALFGRETADRAIAEAATEWESARDSLLAQRDERSRRARRTLGAFAFDASSFSLDSDEEREPLVVFAVPGEVSRGPADAVELTPQLVPSPPWWRDVRDALPVGPDSALRWPRGTIELVARVAGDGAVARVALRDSTRREWTVGAMTAPVRRAMWLDGSVGADARRALRRAFNEAAMYSEDSRIAAGPRRAERRLPALLAARLTLPGSRVAARPLSRRTPARRTSS